MYVDRAGNPRPIVEIRKHPINPDELVDVVYTQENDMPRQETVTKESFNRLFRRVERA